MKIKWFVIPTILFIVIQIVFPISASSSNGPSLPSETTTTRTTAGTITPDIDFVKIGESVQFACTTPSPNVTATWTVRDSNIASVTSNGLVTGISQGRTYLTAMWSGGSKTITINVGEIAEGTHIICNKGTNKYMNVEEPTNGSINADGNNIEQLEYPREGKGEWIVTMLDTGYYTIQCKHTSKYLGVEDISEGAGASIKQYTYRARNYGLQWIIEKTGTDSYKFIPRSGESANLVLAIPIGVTSDGTDLILANYYENINYKNEWEFPTLINASLIAFPEDHDRSSFFDDTASDLATIGYTNPVTTADGMILYDLKFVMNKSKIILLRTHGSQHTVTTNDNPLRDSYLCDLNNTELVIYGACSTAAGEQAEDNLVTATVEKGARTAIGFEYPVEYSSCNAWCMWFFHYYRQYYNDHTKNLDDVCSKTDEHLQDYEYYDCDYTNENNETSHISVKHFYIAGSHSFPNR